MTPEEALIFAKDNFPQAPEELAKILEIEVRRTPLQSDCDGWCVQSQIKPVIRINSSVTITRQRFTLAHELGHLILGVPSVVGETIRDFQRTSSAEEKRVNEFAQELLLPSSIAVESVSEIPVSAQNIRRIAKQAKVSELFVARRLASLADGLGIQDVLVLFYKDDKFAWQWPNSISVTDVQETLVECLQADPKPVKVHRKEDKDVIVACILENPFFNLKTIFLQLVSEEQGLKQSDEEVLHELERYIFVDFDDLRQSIAGCLGAMKSRIEGLSLDQAVELFNDRYLNNSNRCQWDDGFKQRLSSPKGQNYIRLRLKVWVKNRR